MKKRRRDGRDEASIEELIGELTVETGDEHEKYCNFQQACRRGIPLPCEAFVIGEPVSLIGFDYEGNLRHGMTALCRREDGCEYEVAASEVVISPRTEGARYLAAYHAFMGLDPFPADVSAPDPGKSRRGRAAADLDLSGPIELIVLSIKQRAAHCRTLADGRSLTLRATRLWTLVPGEIAVITPRRQWTYAGHLYLSGDIESTRLDAAALGLAPLKLEERGLWDPAEEYWGEEGEPIEEWAKPLIARGPRPAFEMEQVLPDENPGEPWSDPISRSNDLKESGDSAGAYKLLMEACRADLRFCVAWTPTPTSAISSSTTGPKKRFATTRRVSGSASYRSRKASMARCRGAGSTEVCRTRGDGQLPLQPVCR